MIRLNTSQNQQTRLWVTMFALVLSWAAPGTVVAQSNQLQDIEVQTLPSQEVELRFKLNGPAPDPLSFTIDNPARISVDLPDTGLALDSRRKNIGIGALHSVIAAEANGRTRIVLNLDELVPYATTVQGNDVVLTLGAAAASQAAASSSTVASFGSGSNASRTSSSPAGRAITEVDFRRGETGSGMIMVTLTDANTNVDIRQEGNQVTAIFKDTELPTDLMQRLDVLDFATPVSTVDVIRANRDARLTVNANGEFEQLAYQSDNLFIVELAPRVEEEEENVFGEAKVYTGDRLTLNFQDIDTRAVLQLLADTSGLNMVVSDTVQGNVTLRLQNVPWDQALDIVLRTKGLDMRQHDNVILVAPAEEIAERERRDLEARQQIEDLVPLRSEFIQVNYAKAGDLATLISADGNAGTLLSDRGTVAIDERTNTLLVQDTAEKLAEIRRLVRTLDIPIRQVLIESRIVIANDDFGRQIGVRMGASYVTENSSDGLISLTGSGLGSDTIVSSALDNLQTTGQPFPVGLPPIDERFMVNAPVANPAGRATLAILDSDYLLDLELTAMQAENRGEIVSTPRVVTANQKQASIEQGVEIPFQEASSSGATTTQFKKAVLRLEVLPQITPDDKIIMDLTVNNDSVGEQVSNALGGSVPSIDTNEVVTQVLVNNGETVVLGGIYVTERREVDNKVPYLGDVPVLGRLFKSTNKVSNKSELLIFVTPKILKEGASLN